jgi:hypothetical protein
MQKKEADTQTTGHATAPPNTSIKTGDNKPKTAALNTARENSACCESENIFNSVM